MWLLIFESMLKVASCVLFMCKTCKSTKQLVIYVLFMSKFTLCICLCVRPVEAPGSLSFMHLIKLVMGKTWEKKNELVTSWGEGHVLNIHLLINFPVVLIPLSAPGLMLLLLLVRSVNWFPGWDCHALPGSLWGYCIGIYFTVGQLCLGQIIFGPLLHHLKIHHRDNIEIISLNAKTE